MINLFVWFVILALVCVLSWKVSDWFLAAYEESEK